MAPRSTQRRPLWRVAPLGVALITAFVVFVGARGVDFGHHWDEWYHAHGIKKAVEELTLLTHEYTYNGVYFDVGFLLLAPRALAHVPAIKREIDLAPDRPMDMTSYPSILKAQRELKRAVGGWEHTRRARLLCLAISSLVCALTYLVVRRVVPESRGAALFGAAVVGLSFDLVSHARFLAVDAMMASAVAAMLLGLARALPLRVVGDVDRDWTGRAALVLASIAGGFAFGCKMTGLMTCVPIAIAVGLRAQALRDAGASPIAAARAFAVETVLTASTFIATFVVTTPGAVLEPARFYGAIAYERMNYTGGRSFGYDVTGLEHGLNILGDWLFWSAPSPVLPVAGVATVCAAVGLVVMATRARAFTLALLGFVAVMAALLTTGSQFIVRNALVLWPPMAIAIAIGGWRIWLALRGWRRLQHALVAAGTAALIANAAILWHASETIRTTRPDTILSDVATHIEGRTSPVLVSPALHTALAPHFKDRLKGWSCASTTEKGKPRDQVLAYVTDTAAGNWYANQRGLILHTFGSLEVDHARYPNWHGRDKTTRVYLLSARGARNVHLALGNFLRCVPPST